VPLLAVSTVKLRGQYSILDRRDPSPPDSRAESLTSMVLAQTVICKEGDFPVRFWHHAEELRKRHISVSNEACEFANRDVWPPKPNSKETLIP
jgi:hypothetical protein